MKTETRSILEMEEKISKCKYNCSKSLKLGSKLKEHLNNNEQNGNNIYNSIKNDKLVMLSS